MPASVGTYGWGGAFCTYFWVDPREELIGIVMTQVRPYVLTAEAERVLKSGDEFSSTICMMTVLAAVICGVTFSFNAASRNDTVTVLFATV